MEANLEKIINMKITRTVENLKKNCMQATYVPGKKEALALLKTMLVPGEKIAVGGSVTLVETGALDLIRNGEYSFIDRYDKNAGKEEIRRRLVEGLSADTFVTSANAITESGLIYNVDGTGNRAAAFVFGPSRVIVLAGYNKIVTDLAEAVARVKNISAPANAVRLDRDTFCAKNGHCIKNCVDSRDFMCLTPGCCENTICSTAVITGKQCNKDRITVIIIGESLGY